MLPPDLLLHAWNQYADRLLLIVRGFGEPGEDAVQEAFVQLAKRDRLPDETLAWLVRVARNQLLQWWRSDERARHRAQQKAEQQFGRKEWFSESQLEETFDATIVFRTLQQLPESQRGPLMMHIWGGLSFEQIATILNVSRSTAHRQYVAAMNGLRTRLQVEREH